MKQIKIVIFDFDGTIADTVSYTIDRIREFLKQEQRLIITKQRLTEDLQNNTYFQLIIKLKIPWYKIPYLFKRYHQGQKELFKHMDKIKPYPGIKELLVRLKRSGFKIGILSSNLSENINRFLQINNLNLFDYIDCGSHILGKSNAIKNLIKKHNLNKENIIYIGDEVRDIKACKSAGIKIISVTWGLNSKLLLKSNNPDHIASKPLEIVNYL